uniref:WAP domain-containing protein n=1 Tax=Oryza brachyantha TaxID=4533 RepID=J3MJD1_ORYBR
MATHTCQGFLLVLLLCSAVPALTRADVTDCIHNPVDPHPADKIFCCVKDNECWMSIQECLANCPCGKNCS